MKSSAKTILADLRKNLGSQEEVGAEVGIERSRLGRIETRSRNATSHERETIAKYFGTSVDALFDENGKAKVPPPPTSTVVEMGRATDARRAADLARGVSGVMHH